jgi:hypothetical protein
VNVVRLVTILLHHVQLYLSLFVSVTVAVSVTFPFVCVVATGFCAIVHIGFVVSILIVLDIVADCHTISTAVHPYTYVPSASHVYAVVYVHVFVDVFARFQRYNSCISDADNARLYTRTSSIIQGYVFND